MKTTHQGFTKLYDCIVDDYLPRITGSEFKILTIIVRLTFGWNKKRDRISHTQFMKKTALSRRSVTSGIASLSQKNMILITNQSGYKIATSERKYQTDLYYQVILPKAKNALAKAKKNHLPRQILPITIDRDNRHKNRLKHIKITDQERLAEILKKQGF